MYNYNDAIIYRAKWIEVCGTMYKSMCALVIGIDDEFPVFGKVSSVYVLDGEVIFAVHKLYTCSFNTHFHAFEVQNTTDKVFIRYEKLQSHVPLHLKFIPNQNNMMVVLKHRLPF